MRGPCARCKTTYGRIETRNGQDCVFCAICGGYQYCAPKTETGRKPRTVSAAHELLSPKRKAFVILRATGRCEMCGAKPEGTEHGLHVSHIISVKKGIDLGMTDAELNDPENLIAACDACNLGLGDETIPLRLAVAIVRARIATGNDGRTESPNR